MSRLEDSKGRGNSGPGRPLLPEDEKKRSRSLTISDRAWLALENILRELELKSVSDLVEKIGLHRLRVSTQSEPYSDLSSVPIYKRLKFLMRPPVAVFWSLLAFVRRTAQQLVLHTTEDFLCDVVKRSISVAFYVGYTHPDIYINNPSALLRWVSYRILLAEASTHQNRSATEISQESDLSIDNISCDRRGLHIIHNAIKQLDEFSIAPHYRVLQMKSIDGLTLGQVIKISDLQSFHKTESEFRAMLKKGLYDFRELWTRTNYALDDVEDSESDPIKYPEEVCAYYDLAMSANLQSKEDIEKLNNILIKTSNNSRLDFWINEIDYHYEFTLNKDIENYTSTQEGLLKRIDEEIEGYLGKRLKELIPHMASCTTKEAVESVLQAFTKQEVGDAVPLNILLGLDLSK